jgi:hypothetical protein
MCAAWLKPILQFNPQDILIPKLLKKRGKAADVSEIWNEKKEGSRSSPRSFVAAPSRN